MKKELLFPLLLATASLTASFNCAADWQDTSNLPPEPPPEELLKAAAAAAAAAPGAMPVPTPAPAATPVQIEVLPAPVPVPIEEIKSVTPVVSTWHTPRATSIVLHDATLRTRPTVAGTGDPIAAETRVRMESNISNADGNWWYVTATGIGGGWLLETELGDPQN
jgi:hypothetical protein